MLDLDLDLEADLGVDTVKQAEVFAAVREAYGIPRDDNMRLRDFPTLAHVMQFVRDKRPDLAATAAAAPSAIVAARRSSRRGATSHCRSSPGKSPGDRRAKDRLSEGHAGPGPRSGSRPRRRHGEASGSIRSDS